MSSDGSPDAALLVPVLWGRYGLRSESEWDLAVPLLECETCRIDLGKPWDLAEAMKLAEAHEKAVHGEEEQR